MLGFYLMNDEQLGLDPTIQQPDGERCLETTRNDQVANDSFFTKEIIKQAVIVGQAMTSWKAYCNGDELKGLCGNMKNDLKWGSSSKRQRRKGCEVSPGIVITRRSKVARFFIKLRLKAISWQGLNPQTSKGRRDRRSKRHGIAYTRIYIAFL